MKNLIVDGKKYPRIFVYNENIIAKISEQSPKSWQYLKNTDLVFTDKVEKIVKPSDKVKERYPLTRCIVYMQYFLDYQKITNIDASDDEIIDYLQLQFAHLKTMHRKGIIHGDITPQNILIGKRQQMKIIDFETMQIGSIVHPEHKELHGDISIEELKSILKHADKVSSLNMYIHYFCKKHFYDTPKCHYDTCLCEKSNFANTISKGLRKELTAYQRDELDIPEEYYFEDIIDELVKLNYNYGLTKRKPLW